MGKDIKKKKKKLSIYQEVAKELNEVCDLQPPIDEDMDDNELKSEIKDSFDAISEDDDLSEETTKVLKKLGWEASAEEEEEEEEEEGEEEEEDDDEEPSGKRVVKKNEDKVSRKRRDEEEEEEEEVEEEEEEEEEENAEALANLIRKSANKPMSLEDMASKSGAKSKDVQFVLDVLVALDAGEVKKGRFSAAYVF